MDCLWCDLAYFVGFSCVVHAAKWHKIETKK